MSLLLGLLVLLVVGFEQFAVGKDGLVGKLLLVLLPNPVTGITVPHCMLQKHYLQGVFVSVCVNLQLLISDMVLVLRVWMPSLGSCLMSNSS